MFTSYSQNHARVRNTTQLTIIRILSMIIISMLLLTCNNSSGLINSEMKNTIMQAHNAYIEQSKVNDVVLFTSSVSKQLVYNDDKGIGYGSRAVNSEISNLEKIAESVGARIHWGLDFNGACTPYEHPNVIYGSYCIHTPDVIYINDSNNRFTSRLRYGYVYNTLLHELSHRSIYKTCGVITPEIVKRAGYEDKMEAITNAYAVRYYGANMSKLTENHPDEYIIDDSMRTTLFNLASSIHDGECN